MNEELKRTWQRICIFSAFAVAPVALSVTSAIADDRPYTVANYPVEATAKDARTAKRKAIAEGRSRAFRSLLKRLLPVTEYASLDKLKSVDAREFLASVAVRSEEEPRARYAASLDYAFMPDRVRDLLRQNAIPFVDEQAAKTNLIAVYRAPAGSKPGSELSLRKGRSLWISVWRDLDIRNTLTPLSVVAASARIRPDTIEGATGGDASALRIFAGEHPPADGGERILVAIAQPDPTKRALNFVLTGQDDAGYFVLKRAYKVPDGDYAYAMELAAVVGLGVLEGRWKAIKVRAAPGNIAAPSGPLQAVQVWVTYNSFGQWRSIQKIFYEIPGVTDLRIGGQSARSASIALRYPGGGEALKTALATRGLSLQQENGFWVLR